MPFDREKFKRVVHYVISKTSGREGFGSTKLNKVMWFADARFYLLNKRSITGAKYVRREFGPVPHQIVPILKELEQSNLIQPWTQRVFGKDTKRFKSLSPPNIATIPKDEIACIDYWIRHIDEDHTASSISEESHDYAWEIAAIGEELPFASQLATRIRESSGAELDWAKQKAMALGLI